MIYKLKSIIKQNIKQETSNGNKYRSKIENINYISPITIKEFKDIKFVKVMDKEMYYVLEGHNEHTWAADWTYIQADSKYEETIIERINVTQEYIKDIIDMGIINSKFKKLIPYVNDFVDIVIPSLDIVIVIYVNILVEQNMLVYGHKNLKIGKFIRLN